MSEYQMDIIGKIGLEDYSSIYDYMAIVNKNDNLIITINDSGNINIIKQILENNSFAIDLNNNNCIGECCIKAYKIN